MAARTFDDIPPILEPGETVESWEARRGAIVDRFAHLEYGKRPDIPYTVSGRTASEDDALNGAAIRRIVNITVSTELGSYEFPLYTFIPRSADPVPATLLICSQSRNPKPVSMPEGFTMDDVSKIFDRFGIIMDGPMNMGSGARPLDMATDMDNGHWPVPAAIARGQAVAGFYATDAEPDDAEAYPSGLACIFGTERERGEHEWGALAVWAFAASCALDVLLTMPELDNRRIGVIGHSRCGKAALWAGALDTRFSCVVPNNSGCCGAALARGKHGENLASINAFFPHWFAPAFRQYAGHEDDLPFDQHMLLASIAPRQLYVTSGSEDLWSDPAAEHESAVLANAVYQLYGYGAMSPEMPEPDCPVYAGPEGYHVRRGPHLLAEYDWMRVMDHVERNAPAATSATTSA